MIIKNTPKGVFFCDFLKRFGSQGPFFSIKFWLESDNVLPTMLILLVITSKLPILKIFGTMKEKFGGQYVNFLP